MGQEIERKFLVKSDAWKAGAKGAVHRQGYLSSVAERIVRVRAVEGKGFLTIKGLTRGITRSEFECGIPVGDAELLLDRLCEKPLIEKIRYRVPFRGLVFEVDEFVGENAGLVVAEVELEDEARKIELPDWIGEEVSGDPRYFNSALVRRPFTKW
ncbi:MAG: CYTH domain-containing protein [Candidatus Aminicenantes bacterium]|nr:CYTH domain-containing protein [Candidatus Aminicenantes bacterium]NLH77028.1 CYTH domain-containing protein [Acidobacteriota bacterium]